MYEHLRPIASVLVSGSVFRFLLSKGIFMLSLLVDIVIFILERVYFMTF